MKPLPKKYNHVETEKKWQEFWEENKVYKWDESQPRNNTYVIDTPPPTVSGLLHMGHIFSYTQADFIARFQRMSGKTVFYPMGFDDNGLPTERLVEKVEKIRAADLSREDFIQKCENVSKDARAEFRRLFESVALSVDWEQEYHTISDESRKISQMSFLDLHKKGKTYRKLQPMLWDPVDQTAIAQAEIEDKEMPSQKNYLHFGLEGDESVKLEIMTTRPELLGACVAVMYNGDDERYKKLKGKNAITPVFGVKVPLIADEKVDMEKGTGLVMCCTFGDETDIAWWREHNLPTRIMLNEFGKVRKLYEIFHKDTNEAIVLAFERDYSRETEGKESVKSAIDRVNCINVPKSYKAFKQIEGLKCRTTARAKMLELLAEDGAIFKEPEIGVHAEPCAERSGSPLEIMPTTQWFVKITDIKEELKAKAHECNWYPDFMKVRIDQWIDGLNWDWCISRQRYFGVPFPVWYSKRQGEEGKIILPKPEQLPVNPMVDLPEGYTKEEVTPEIDVMDTWATSSVSPQLSSKGISEEFSIDSVRHKKLFPADLRPQAHEIIRTWAFYTIVKAHLHEEQIPWKNLMISGWCLASDKTKMSKSKGNVVTPVSLIEEKGADVVRFWASTSKLGADTAYSEDVLKIGKKLVNKLWNATKFAAIHLDNLSQLPTTAKDDIQSVIICETIDLWIIARLKKTIETATVQFEKYEYSSARSAIEDFFWNDFCDNYLEISKVRVYAQGKGSLSASCTIYHCLDAILRLFAPIVPHITDELYSHIFEEKTKQFGGSIHNRGTWLDANDYTENEQAEQSGIACVQVLDAVRKLKASENVSIKTPLELLVISGENSENIISNVSDDLKNVTNSHRITFSHLAEDSSVKTDDGKFAVSVKFAKQSETA